jgi:hypothetical protein
MNLKEHGVMANMICRNCSGLSWDWKPGIALEQAPQHAKHAQSLLAGGRDVAAHGQERLGPGQRAPAAGNLLLQLDHAQIPLGLVVVERHPKVVQEPQHLVTVSVQAGQ